MRASLFSFFRGTAPLFAADWAAEAPAALRTCPNAWLCGDAHLENFGTYRAKHGLVVFDLNDFDETWLGPLLYDVARLTTSARVWEEEAGVTGTGYGHCDELVGAYAAALCDGKALWIDRDIATGRIAKLMEQVYARKYADLLAKHTVVDRAVEGKQRHLAFGKRALVVTLEQRARAV
ncbi:MAG: DUF2252 family protein, partial [Candidatus Eremiobacteraeota bacterium]|nr:DUF2252 family protein [Candidatus Eremiobacteraeota bacterium]